jgi:uncharacterized membrane protein
LYTLPGGTSSQANAVNSAGVAVGWWGNVVTGIPTAGSAFRWEAGIMHDLAPDLGVNESIAADISDSGLITGQLWTESGRQYGFVWDQGRVQVLPPVPHGFSSAGAAISDDGWVAGHGLVELSPRNLALRSFIWDGQTMTSLGILPGTKSCRVTGMTNSHDVIGYCYDGPDLDKRPFLWSQGVMHELRDLIDEDGVLLFNAEGISQNGEIVTYGNVDSDGHTILLRPVAALFGDLTCDGTVGTSDLQSLLSAWGPCASPECPEDLDRNGTVNGHDLAFLLSSWSTS